MEFSLQVVGDRGFARARKTGKPQQHGLLSVQPRPRRFADLEGLEIGVCSAAQREPDQAGRNRRIAVAVDQYKPPSNPILLVWSKPDRLNRGDVDERDFVAMQFLCRQMLPRCSI